MRGLQSLPRTNLPLQNLNRNLRPPSLPHRPTKPQLPRSRRQGQTRTYTTGGPGPEAKINNSNSNSNNKPTTQNASQAKEKATVTRAERILARLPPRLGRYTTRLRGAPLTHVVAFLALHEITAVLPLLGLFGLFHYNPQLVPVSYMVENYGGYVAEGVGRFERYFRRKGWFGFGESGVGHEKREAGDREGEGEGEGKGHGEVLELWREGEYRYRVVVEVALAYALTKVLLPVRIAASVWATPWFAGVLMRARALVRRGR
ncbi:Mitochondrial seryl-tRNA synthetase [Madurella fahalii]|uniref:Mitochondrial seryl-tRNA synthetase n=1 Tax=Madurella fahalii TaxID=1157608 RepID=A0ABQ0G8Y5_9PEZI